MKKAAARKSKVTIDPQGILLDAPDFRLQSADVILITVFGTVLCDNETSVIISYILYIR